MYFVDLKSLSKELILEILSINNNNAVSPERFLEKRNKGSDDTCIRISSSGEIYGYSSRNYYLNLNHKEMSVDDYLNLVNSKRKNKVSNLLSDVKSLFSKLDEDAFENFCSDGQEAILEFCNKYNIDTSDFLPEKEYYFNIETMYLEVPGNVNPDEITFRITAVLPDGEEREIDVDTVVPEIK